MLPRLDLQMGGAGEQLRLASEHGYTAAVEALVRQGANVNEKDQVCSVVVDVVGRGREGG